MGYRAFSQPPSSQPSRTGLNPLILIGVLVGLVILLVICGAAIFVVTSVLRLPTAAPGSEADVAVPTAREAYPPAVEVIRAEDPGALLASGAGAWTPVINTANLSAGRTGWTFHFYLPASNRMAWVVVDRERTARITRIDEWETRPDLLDDQAWQVDSAQAVQIALQTCQSALDAHPDAVVEARLSMAASNRALVWLVSVTPPASPELACQVSVDATTGRPR